MYSRKVTDAALNRIESQRSIRLTRHPISFVEASVAHLNNLMQEDGSLRRPLTQDESEFVRNERIVCKLDFNYWRSRYAWIKNYAGNTLVRYVPNIAQSIMNDICAEMEEEGIAILVQQLKARQLGVTTDTEMRIAHRVQFYPHVEAVVASSRPEKSEEMSNKMTLCWENMPWWLMPRQTSGRAGSLIEFGDLPSSISIQHGAQLTGIARGTTPNIVHLSELCEFSNPEELVDAALMRAFHHSPFGFFVMESTALGRGNWWHNTWLISKEGWPTRTADFRPIFLPWFVGSDIYPDDTWLRAHPVPPDWIPSPVAAAHRIRCQDYVSVNPLLRKYLGEDWRLPDRQLWWWEVQRNIAIKKKALAQFYMECPADDLEAFQSTNISVFDAEQIAIQRESTKPPIAIFGFIGNQDEFPVRTQPASTEIDSSLSPIPIRARLNQSQTSVDCHLAPLKFPGYSNFNEMGKLILWEMPEDGEEYGIGVDTSEGVGQDRSVIQILRKGTYFRNDAVVGEFASPRLNSIDLFPFVFVTGCFFSTSGQGDEDSMIRRPKMVIECRWNGENTQLELQKRGWPHFHKWTRYHKTRYNIAAERSIGWYTNSWSRPTMMDYWIKSVRDGWIDISSPYLVDENENLEMDEVGQSIKALHGSHDDRVMAAGITYFSLHIMEIDSNMPAMRRSSVTREKARAPVYQSPYQARDIQDVSGSDIYRHGREDDDE